ncbi:hypothetical protein IM146_04900 [Staphylococcus epidermidis]|uniref:hypothetical protein n=1 Tax=Staphylococcus epidermidis TaxID=1282 RepID=UPI001882EBC8|nr:hypothetical protein [Staphylococcus epidermidis]MBE9439720.1 hypothetical protein [Staphylococcus epidermidis]
MVKIKRKVKMTLPELIEWAWKNGVKEKAFYSNVDGGSVYFDMLQTVSVEHSIDRDETFTVEVEEEIDIYTVLESLYEYTNDNQFKHYKNTPLQIIKDYEDKEFWLKDGDTMTLIWKDGELVGDE